MELEQQLALRVLAAHPREAAQVTERLPAESVAGLLGATSPKDGAHVLAQMPALVAGRVLVALPVERAAALLTELPVDLGVLFLRGLAPELRDPILGALPRGRARALRSLLGFAEGTAGALMDPEVLALPEDLTAREAVERVRESPHAARYNVYIVDREQHLVGVINQRELLLASPDATLSSFMTRRVHRLSAQADRVAVVSHPAWRAVHSLPVVDRGGIYLGTIRYRAFRELEEALREKRAGSSLTAQALGDLLRTGASAVLEMFATPAAEGGSRDAR